MRDLNELERRFVQSPLKRLVALEIAVGFLDNDLALSSRRSSTLRMSNAGKSASCAPSAMFSRSRNTAMVASESCILISYDVSDIAFPRQRKLRQQHRWRLFRAENRFL